MFQFSHPQTPLRQAITNAYRRDEAEAVDDILQAAAMSEQEKNDATALARRLVLSPNTTVTGSGRRIRSSSTSRR